MQDVFGEILKEWRQIRRMSQLELALSAGVSARHISFLETGRSRPSRGMILRLSEELDMPRGARNQLLISAGLAAVYDSRSLNEADMAPLKQAVDWTLSQHAPYPAIAVDRHWQLEALNRPAEMLFSGVGLKAGDSLLTAFLGDHGLRSALINLEEVERLMLSRLRTELAHFGRDPVLEAAIAQLQANVQSEEVAPTGISTIIPAIYQVGDTCLSFFSTIAQFGGIEDVAMSELRIELFFPADEDTRRAIFAMVEQG